MKKYFWSLLMACIMAMTGFAQQEITIGNGNSVSAYVPIRTYYKYSSSQSIYLEDEIGMTGLISSVSYYPTSTKGDARTLKVYMATTDKTEFASGSEALDFNEMTLVYDGTHSFVAGSWNKLEFETPFEYAGGNLVIGFQDATGAYIGTTEFKCDSKANITLCASSDGSLPNPISVTNDLPQIVLEISDVEVTCAAIDGKLTVSNIEATTANVSWTAEAGATYQYQYKIATESWNEDLTTVSDGSIDLSELSALTTYNVRVRRYCSDDDVSFWKSATFKTPCAYDDVEIPWTYNFDVENAIECWFRPVASTGSYPGYPKMLENTSYACHSGGNCLEFKGNSDQIIAMPPIFGADITGLRVCFYYRINENSIGTPQVGFMTDVNDPTTFTPVKTLEATGTGTAVTDWKYEKVSLEAAGEAKYIAFRFDGAGYGTSMYVDDITVEELPSCSGITGTLTIKEVSDNSATLEFVDDSPNHSAWKVYYKLASEDDDQYVGIATTDKEVTLSGLNTAANYMAYVVTDCGIEEGEISNIVKFSTTAIPVDVNSSLTIDFEDENVYNEHLQLAATSTTDGWKVGSFVKKEGEKALYMSQLYNDDGTAKEDNNNFTHSVYNHAYAVIPLTFGESAEQNISFDWKGVGQEIYSSYAQSLTNPYYYMSVYLVPSSVSIPNEGEVTGDGVITLLNKGWGKKIGNMFHTLPMKLQMALIV